MAALVAGHEEQPISRTYQYRKVMKPMLERKRRARINRCLDELKELLVGALQAEGESVSRLEKADVLELTVRHLHKLRRAHQLSEAVASEKFRSGFSHCASEVSKYMSNLTSSIEITVSSRLLTHLDTCIHQIDNQNHTTVLLPQSSPSPIINYTPPSSPVGESLITNNQKIISYPSPAHIQNVFGLHYISNSPPISSSGSSHYQTQRPIGQQPLSLCMKEEPFDLSKESVWRPW